MTAVSKFTKQWISPLYSSSCKQTVGWVLPMLWVGFVGLSFLSFLGVEAAQFAKSFVLFMCPKCTCMYACHTNFDLFASYLFQCGQDFILCQYSQRLQWKLFTILIYFPTSEGTDENPSKENSHSQILSLLCPLNEICRWSLYNLSCKNETSLKSGHLEHKKGIEMFLLQEVYLELGARASNPISHHTAEGRPMGYPCLL